MSSVIDYEPTDEEYMTWIQNHQPTIKIDLEEKCGDGAFWLVLITEVTGSRGGIDGDGKNLFFLELLIGYGLTLKAALKRAMYQRP